MTDMTAAEKQVIWDFAQGDRRKRDAAVAIHRKYCATLGPRGTPEQRYMAEVDNPVPGLALRARSRVDMLMARGPF